MSNKLQVKKANFLVPLEEAVSKPAQLLASYLVASLPKSTIEANDLPKLRFPYRELRRAINADGKERVNKVQDIMDLGVELQKCVLFYEDARTEKTVSWLIEQSRDKKDSTFEYTLHPGLKKYLMNLEGHFTKYNYLFRVCLNAHAMKLYEILKMYQYKGEVVMHIEDDIKPSLGLKGKYPKIYDFKRRVMNVAQVDIQKYTDIRFDYEIAEKKGKTPISYRFLIYSNRPTKLPKALLEKFDAQNKKNSPTLLISTVEGDTVDVSSSYIVSTLKKWGGKEVAIKKLLTANKRDQLNYQMVHLKRLIKSGKEIGNPFAWLMKALKEDYRDSVQDQRMQHRRKAMAGQKNLFAKQEREESLKTTEGDYYRQVRTICDELLEKNSELLVETVEELKSTMAIRKAIQKGKTPQEMYENKFTTGTIQNNLMAKFPNLFKKLNNQYLPEIARLKKQM